MMFNNRELADPICANIVHASIVSSEAKTVCFIELHCSFKSFKLALLLVSTSEKVSFPNIPSGSPAKQMKVCKTEQRIAKAEIANIVFIIQLHPGHAISTSLALPVGFI